MNPNLKAFHAVIPECIYVVDDVDFADVIDDNTEPTEISSMARLTEAKLAVHEKRQDCRVPATGPEEQYIELIKHAHKLLTIFDW